MRRYDDGIPYDIVTRKLNDWYTAIRNNLDKEATSLKKEVEKFIGRVDKNSDVFFIISF
ncbi:Response regulator aspartate phosphatase I [Bacillus licheniformis]|nr:Response regulator aspartate phosphatase I [Bacillus licheniformis]